MTDHLRVSLPGRRAAPAAKLTVLVVDDDPWVRMVLEAVLQGQGCEARLASGGREALEVYRRHPRAIDLVLLDVLMPGMGGCETLDALRKINPGVRCCFMSVATTGDDAEAERLLRWGVDFVLPKPYSLDQIRGLLRRLRAG